MTVTKEVPVVTKQGAVCTGVDSAKLSATASSELCCEAVRERAYLLWEKAGCPQGDGSDFWYEAEEQLRNELSV